MIRRPPRSTQSRSSAASDVYKRQTQDEPGHCQCGGKRQADDVDQVVAVSYTHLRAHETKANLVCRLLLEKKNIKLIRQITRTQKIPQRNNKRRAVAIQKRVESNIVISQSSFRVKVRKLFIRSRRKTNKRKSKRSAMLRQSVS